MRQWNYVEDTLPPENQPVLVCTEQGLLSAETYNGSFKTPNVFMWYAIDKLPEDLVDLSDEERILKAFWESGDAARWIDTVSKSILDKKLDEDVWLMDRLARLSILRKQSFNDICDLPNMYAGLKGIAIGVGVLPESSLTSDEIHDTISNIENSN